MFKFIVKFGVWAWTLIVGGMAALGSLGMLFSRGHGQAGVSVFMLVIGFAPLALLIRSGRARKARWRALHAQMLSAAGVVRGAMHEHSEDGSAIAVNPQARTVTLMAGDVWTTYAFADIRGWSSKLVRADQYLVGGSALGGAAALSANASARRDAAAESGLFVEVRDMGHPKWRVAMSDPRAQERWMEILRQEINESHAGAGHALA